MKRPASEYPVCTQSRPAPAHVVAVGLLGEQALDQARARLERRRRLEQRRDVDILLDAEQLGEEDRDENSRRALALGDQVADRRVAIDVLYDLRGERELADGCRVLEIERLEVDRLGLGRADHLDDARQRLALGEVARPRLVHEGAERVVDLHRVDAQVDVRGAEPRRLKECRERRHGLLCLGAWHRIDQGIEQRDDRLGRDQIVAVAARDDVGRFRQREAVAPDPLQRLDMLVDSRNREIELAGDLARQALHLAAIVDHALEREEAVADIVQRRALLPEPDEQRERPLDVGAPVEVVADPRGDRRERRLELESLVAETLGRRLEEGRREIDVGVAQVPDRLLHARCS